jgi:hypothetical protein
VIGSVTVGKPHNIAIHPNGQVAYAGSQVPGNFSLAIIDLSTRSVTQNVPLEKLRVAWNSTPMEGDYTLPKRESTRSSWWIRQTTKASLKFP